MNLDVLKDHPDRWEPFRNGDRAVLTAVYRETVKDVTRLVQLGFTGTQGKVVRVLGVQSPEEQRDLVQEVYLKAFAEKARRAYDVNQTYRPYLMRIAKNLMIDRLRKQGRETLAGDGVTAPDIDDLVESEAPVAPHDEDDVDSGRLTSATRDFVGGQTDEERQFIKLRFEEGMSQAQVAKELGVTRRWVRTQEETARRGLERHLKKTGLFELVRARLQGGTAELSASEGEKSRPVSQVGA